tara:strand:+ start:2887 stop:3525 length:639 start_codon:yes stop_codon:yes gene_type:complete
MNNIKLNIEDIFQYEPRPPFSVNLNIADANNIGELFTKMKDLYIKGLIILTTGSLDISGNKVSLEIDKVKQRHINIMEKHMLSFGIKTTFMKLTLNDKDALLRYLLYDLEKEVPDLNLNVLINWRTQHIMKIDFQIDNKKKEQILNNVNTIVARHNVSNIFLKIKKSEVLREFGIIVKKKYDPNDITVIYFDFANRANYQKIHKCLKDSIIR